MHKANDNNIRKMTLALLPAVVLVGALFFPGIVMAQGVGEAGAKVTSFFESITGLLNIASIAVVTIAVIFAGYQIAFAHKRIGDVAPILIGGFLIGAAAQIAKMLLGDGAGSGGGMAILINALPLLHA
ncbi:MAG TPA: TrbC/VirB2 family protein [Pseudoxanthomonas sp.]|nr:TrbC/VirB2 family protein [Pseudoxanthomonas sp.]